MFYPAKDDRKSHVPAFGKSILPKTILGKTILPYPCLTLQLCRQPHLKNNPLSARLCFQARPSFELSYTLDFLNRIADLSSAGMRVAAILPRGYLKKDRPKANAEMRRRYRVLDEIELPADAFAPLTKIATTLYLLGVEQDGRLIDELQPVRSSAVIERESKPEGSAAEAVSELQPVLSKQLTGDAAVAFLSEINQRCPAPDYPRTVDGRPRALLPDELIERLKANSQRTLRPKRTDYYTVWSDDALALMRAKGCDQWVACGATRDGEYRPLPLIAHVETEFVQGATLFEALDALREHGPFKVALVSVGTDNPHANAFADPVIHVNDLLRERERLRGAVAAIV